MPPIHHNDTVFEANADYDIIEQWCVKNNIEYELYEKPISFEPGSSGFRMALKGQGYIKIIGFTIINEEDFIAAKLRWL